MIELKESRTTAAEAIRAIIGKKAYYNIETVNGKITRLQYDDTKLTAQEKTNIENAANTENPNLTKEVR